MFKTHRTLQPKNEPWRILGSNSDYHKRIWLYYKWMKQHHGKDGAENLQLKYNSIGHGVYSKTQRQKESYKSTILWWIKLFPGGCKWTILVPLYLYPGIEQINRCTVEDLKEPNSAQLELTHVHENSSRKTQVWCCLSLNSKGCQSQGPSRPQNVFLGNKPQTQHSTHLVFQWFTGHNWNVIPWERVQLTVYWRHILAESLMRTDVKYREMQGKSRFLHYHWRKE